MDSVFQRRTITLFISVVVLGALFSFLRPFGTDGMPFMLGTTYWMGLFIAGFLAILTVDIGAASFGWKLRPWHRIIIYSLAVTAVVSGIVVHFHKITGLINILEVILQVLVISVVAIALRELLDTRQMAKSEAEEDATPRLSTRLPIHLQSAQIYALCAEDHYVRVITSAGDELLLLRLTDAIAEMDSVEGIATHRSWWVAADGVAKIGKSGRNIVIDLKSGSKAQVSRAGAALVKQAGWLS